MERFNGIIIDFFEEFNTNGIKYCVLRNYRSVQEINEAEDLDVSVAEEDKDNAQRILANLGWMTPRININKYGHQQFYKWNGARIYKLDIIWGFYYSDGRYSISNPDQIYLNCDSFHEAKIPRTSDGINLLFYHVLLDKGVLSVSNKDQLQWLLSKEEKDSSMDLLFYEKALSKDKKSEIVSSLVEQRRIEANNPIMHRLSVVFKRAFMFFRKKTFKIAFIGVDGAGKSTVVNSLMGYYKNEASMQYFGFKDYQSDIAKKRFECEKKKKSIPIVSPLVSVIIQYYDMLIRYRRVMRAPSRLKIFDRYVWEANENADTLVMRLLYFVFFKLFFPGVDGVVYLYCPEEISFQRKDDIIDKEQFITKKKRIDSIYLNRKNVKQIDTYINSNEEVLGETVSYIFSVSHGLIK